MSNGDVPLKYLLHFGVGNNWAGGLLTTPRPIAPPETILLRLKVLDGAEYQSCYVKHLMHDQVIPTIEPVMCSPIIGTIGHEVPFSAPWHEHSGGLLHLEHVNIRTPSQAPVKQLYFDILGFGPDERRAREFQDGTGTLWANIGTTQLHLPSGDPEVLPGTIGLVFPDLYEVRSRLQRGGYEALEGTKFAWKDDGGDDGIVITCPYGNQFRLHKRAALEGVDPGPLDARGGSLPSPTSLGHGIAYVHVRVRPGTAAGIGRFYREFFGAEVQDVGPEECSALGLEGGGGQAPASAGAVVRVGPAQHLGFFESDEPLPAWDGHHVCVYLSDEAFRRNFEVAERKGLVFVNPRRNYGKADTLDQALVEKQYRIKRIVDWTTGELLHELEHEIRSVSHPAFPVGRDVPVS